MKTSISSALAVFLIATSPAVAAPKSLKGEVKEDAQVRIARPAVPVKAGIDDRKRQEARIDTSSFDLSAAANTLQAHAADLTASAAPCWNSGVYPVDATANRSNSRHIGVDFMPL